LLDAHDAGPAPIFFITLAVPPGCCPAHIMPELLPCLTHSAIQRHIGAVLL
jgi:hypothetical protein